LTTGFTSGFFDATGVVFLAGTLTVVFTGVLPVEGTLLVVANLYDELPLEVTPAIPEIDPLGPRRYSPLEVMEPGT
jgi:hypothetical protein